MLFFLIKKVFILLSLEFFFCCVSSVCLDFVYLHEIFADVVSLPAAKNGVWEILGD